MLRFIAAFSLSDDEEGEGVESCEETKMGEEGQDIDGQIKAVERSSLLVCWGEKGRWEYCGGRRASLYFWSPCHGQTTVSLSKS